MPKLPKKDALEAAKLGRARPRHSAAYMNAHQVAALLGLSYSALTNLRVTGTGPENFLSGDRRTVYAIEDVIDWVADTQRFYADGSYGPDVKDNYLNRGDPNHNPDANHYGPLPLKKAE